MFNLKYLSKKMMMFVILLDISKNGNIFLVKNFLRKCHIDYLNIL